jgi:hypothetical protein
MNSIKIYVEIGVKKIFAETMDWPGLGLSGRCVYITLFFRRVAWPVLDHAWEIEDRTL